MGTLGRWEAEPGLLLYMGDCCTLGVGGNTR